MTPMLTPQLAERGGLCDLEAYCRDNRWVGTQKCDGHRRLVLATDGNVTALNRRGAQTSLPPQVAAEFRRIKGTWAFDGELLQQHLVIFDLPVGAGQVSPTTTYAERRAALEGVFPAWAPDPAHVTLLPASYDVAAKAGMAHRTLTSGAEGMIFNHVDGRYEPGRRNRHMVKIKYVKEVDCVVTELGREGKQNMVLAVYDGDRQVEVGECTALAGDGPRVKVGDVVAVRYLTWSGERLVQPTFPKIRGDEKVAEECSLAQLTVGNTRAVL